MRESGTLLDWVANAEEVLITRHGKAVARLAPAETSNDQTKAKQAAARICARSVGATLGELRIKDLVDEGRP